MQKIQVGDSSEIENLSEEEIEKRKQFIENLSPKKKFKYNVTHEYTPGNTKPSLEKRKKYRRKKNKMSRKARRK